jgi:hypothetical protein
MYRERPFDVDRMGEARLPVDIAAAARSGYGRG